MNTKDELEFRINENILSMSPIIFNGYKLERLLGNQSKYYSNGLYYLGLENFEEAIKCFFKSAYIQLIFHNIRFGDKYPNLKKHEDTYLSGVNGQFHNVMNCGNESMIQKFFENIKVLPKEDKNGINVISLMLKKGLITQNQTLIDTHAAQLRKKKVENQRGYEKGEMMCLLGILDNNINQINSGIDFLIKSYIRDYNHISKLSNTALWATAMVRLARRLNFEPDISNSFICKELVFMADVSFEPDDELKSYEKQLEEINTRLTHPPNPTH